ncbi:MAG: hypothetical protein IJX28_07770 [Clostridia bacterium]|nr:hypothetical protein [Clostridia bacterium]
MKPRKSFFIKTLLSLTVAACLLAVGILHIFASAKEPFALPDSPLAPRVELPSDIVINDGSFPISKEQHSAKFDVYTHRFVEENGATVVSVYSREQITDLQARRAAGEWMYLTGEEALYLLDDTIRLFRDYDEIRIHSLDGTEHIFRGVSFYGSPEYEAAFGGLLKGNTNASFDLRRDLYEAMLYRIEALQSGITREKLSGKGEEMVAYIGRSQPVDQATLDLNRHSIVRYFLGNGYLTTKNIIQMEEELKTFHFGALVFYQEGIYYVDDLSLVDREHWTPLYPKDMLEPYTSIDKYDQTEEKVVVIELWETATQSCIARLRLDSASDPKSIDELQSLWTELKKNIGFDSPIKNKSVTSYRAVVYLNGFDSIAGCSSFRYQPDGDLDQWQPNPGESTFESIGLAGSQRIAEYINALLSEALR